MKIIIKKANSYLIASPGAAGIVLVIVHIVGAILIAAVGVAVPLHRVHHRAPEGHRVHQHKVCKMEKLFLSLL